MSTPTTFQLLHGRDTPPDSGTQLHAGSLTALFDNGDLRSIRVGVVELVQRIYLAVRDDVWNTIPAAISDVSVRQGDDSFDVTFTAHHAYAAIDFTWTGRITGDRDGTVTYEFNGTAGGDFRFAKIGFNVHHPLVQSVGRPYRAHTPGGEVEGELPSIIDPQRLVEGRLTAIFPEYDKLTLSPTDSVQVEFTFEGDLFEMQDHRNWTDANYKSYGTPLSVPWPMDAHAGQSFFQRITVRAVGSTAAAAETDSRVTVFGQPAGSFPAIGSTLVPDHLPLSEREIELIRRLDLDHLRVDVYLEDTDWREWFRAAAAACASLNSSVELAVFVADGTHGELSALADELRSAGIAVARVFVFAEGRGFAIGRRTTPPELMEAVRNQLRSAAGEATFIGGTNQFFAELNREYPDPASIDGAVYSFNPQTHASDDRSVMENLQGQEDTVATTQHHLPERSVHVSPVSLIGRFGPYPGGPPADGGLPGNVDVRQMSLFTAAWAVGTLSHLARAGAASISLFEVVGPRGLIERDAGPARPEFPSVAGMVFPVYDVLAVVAPLRTAERCEVGISTPGWVDALALRDAHGSTKVLVANITGSEHRVRVDGLGSRGASVCMLDADTVSAQLNEPRSAAAGFATLVHDEPLTLPPYAVAILATGDPA